MVLPSVQDFLTRSAWLIRAGENKWPENMKAQKPSQKMGSSPVKAKSKENRPKVCFLIQTKQFKYRFVTNFDRSLHRISGTI